MRNLLVAIALISPIGCLAQPLVTISCESLKGQSQNYGVTPGETLTAISDHKPPPANHLAAPAEDGFRGKPTFILDSNRRKLTLVWTESPGETEWRKFAQEHGTKVEPDPARDFPVIAYSPLVITALDAHPGKNDASMLYSFYPKLGVVFVAQHYLNFDASYAAQSAFVAKCEFSWSGNP